MRWLKRDFGIFPVAVVDVQLIYRSMNKGDLISFDKLLKIMVPEFEMTREIREQESFSDGGLAAPPPSNCTSTLCPKGCIWITIYLGRIQKAG